MPDSNGPLAPGSWVRSVAWLIKDVGFPITVAVLAGTLTAGLLSGLVPWPLLAEIRAVRLALELHDQGIKTFQGQQQLDRVRTLRQLRLICRHTARSPSEADQCDTADVEP
jgi:hypothetical protein